MDYADECRELFTAVIEKAVDDLDYLACMERHAGSEKHKRNKIKKISEYPPDEFLESRWFEEICDYLGASPERIRSEVTKRLGAASGY